MFHWIGRGSYRSARIANAPKTPIVTAAVSIAARATTLAPRRRNVVSGLRLRR
jgi:hypothetical protein